MIRERILVIVLALVIGLQARAGEPVVTWSFDPGGYASPGSVVAHCTVQAPPGGGLFSLLWYPNLPAGWTVTGTWGDGAPEYDGVSVIAFLGNPLATNGIVAFSYCVQIPEGVANAWIVQPDVVAQLAGEDNPWYGSALPVTIDEAGAIAASVWHDQNGNGVRDAGEPGLSNVTVNLLNLSSNVLFTTRTDASGMYAFASLAPAAYLLQFLPPGGFVFTVPDAGGDNSITNSAANPASGESVPFMLLPKQVDVMHHAGLYLPARVFGYAFVDQNTNSVFDGGDRLATNLTVRLQGQGQVLATATDATGQYQFTGLAPGSCTVVFCVRTSATVLASVAALPVFLPASTNINRTRAVVSGLNVTASVTVGSGDGVLAGQGEPINIGFTTGTVVSAMLINAYAAAPGVVVEVEFSTILASSTNAIVLYLLRDGSWVSVGQQVAVEGTKRYRFIVPGLSAGDICNLKVCDDTGAVSVDENQQIGTFAVQSLQNSGSGLSLSWSVLPGRIYSVYRTDRLVGGSWVLVQTMTNTSMTGTSSTFNTETMGRTNEFYKVNID
ncbi:MAG: SdrD B-like domain-containing protein [bacterium]